LLFPGTDDGWRTKIIKGRFPSVVDVTDLKNATENRTVELTGKSVSILLEKKLIDVFRFPGFKIANAKFIFECILFLYVRHFLSPFSSTT